MEWSREKTSAPEEGDGWEPLYKMVPAEPPREGYPDYRVGHLYRHKGEVIMCAKGFHASPCYAFCKKYAKHLKNVRYLKVLLHVKEDGRDKKVGDKLYVLEERTLSEVKATVVVCRTSDGTIYHTRGLEIHREERDEQDHILPAVIWPSGTRKWYRDGKFHRDDRDEQGLTLPAVIDADGTQEWWTNGERHRDDRDAQGRVLPAMVFVDGPQYWYRNDKLHREDKDAQGRTLPAVIWANGTQKWYRVGLRHREDRDAQGRLLPAVIGFDGKCEWWLNGERAISLS